MVAVKAKIPAAPVAKRDRRYAALDSLRGFCLEMAKALPSHVAVAAEDLDAVAWTAPQLAEAYGVLRDAADAIADATKALSEQVARLAQQRIPEAFENEDISSFTTLSGYRVTVSERMVASIVGDKETAFQWLRDNGLDALVIETVNASTLSAAAKKLLEDDGKELPDDKFKTTILKQTSMTRTKK